MLDSKLELSDVEFSIECLPECTPIRGNLIAPDVYSGFTKWPD